MADLQSIVVVVAQYENRFLLGKRTEGRSYGGMWEFIGGKLEGLETPLQAAQREFLEETSIQMDADLLSELGFAEVDGYKATFFLYRLTGLEKPVLEHEHSEFRMFDIAQLETLNIPAIDRKAIELIKKRDLANATSNANFAGENTIACMYVDSVYPQKDVVNHPAHYELEAVILQPRDGINRLSYPFGAALKYAARKDHKGTPEKDLEKLINYLDWDDGSYFDGPVENLDCFMLAEFWAFVSQSKNRLIHAATAKFADEMVIDINRPLGNADIPLWFDCLREVLNVADAD